MLTMKILRRVILFQLLSVSVVSSFLQPQLKLRSFLCRIQIIDGAGRTIQNLKYKTGCTETETSAEETKAIDISASSKQPNELMQNIDKQPKIQFRRPLGSMELFMLPRPNHHTSPPTQRPPMNHVCAFLLSSTPSISALRIALDNAVRTHPLLRARIVGDGKPRKWLDPLRRIVRWGGEARPLEFVVYAADEEGGQRFRKQACQERYELNGDSTTTFENPDYWGGSFGVVNVPGSTKDDLERSWQMKFEKDLDSETAVAINADDADARHDSNCSNLWKMELHCLSSDNNNSTQQPCAILMTMNHCISDQGSFNMVMDQILSDVAEIESIENDDNTIKHPAISQPLPINLCESLLGQSAGKLNASTIFQSISSPSFQRLREYVRGKFLESFKRLPALLPVNKSTNQDGTGGGIITPASILLSGANLNGSRDMTNVKSNVQYRYLPPEITSALVKRSKSHRVPISMALAAAVAATCADHFNLDKGNDTVEGSQNERTYKILQSLDTRRFSGASDSGDTLSCQAGAMDLMLHQIPDFLGRQIRHHSQSSLNEFWRIAKQCFDQTSTYLKSGDAIEAVRLFDIGMTISDIGRLVETYARSNASMGRAWSAGITNAGEYERQQAVERVGLDRGLLKKSHGNYKIHEIYYAASHAKVGCTYPVGCMSVGGGMSFSINPPYPLISEMEIKLFADDFIELLRTVAVDEDTCIKPET